jgi:hypothetical protein
MHLGARLQRANDPHVDPEDSGGPVEVAIAAAPVQSAFARRRRIAEH